MDDTGVDCSSAYYGNTHMRENQKYQLLTWDEVEGRAVRLRASTGKKSLFIAQSCQSLGVQPEGVSASKGGFHDQDCGRNAGSEMIPAPATESTPLLIRQHKHESPSERLKSFSKCD